VTDWLSLTLSELGTPPSARGSVPKLPESPKSLHNVCFVDFGTFGTRCEDEAATLAERTAMALEGGVPTSYAEAFAALQLGCPDNVDEARWRQAIDDIAIFLDTWGLTADRLGWGARDVIGLRFMPAALAWALQGARAVTLTATAARLSDGRMFTLNIPEPCRE
jgi:hypothetical protein